MESSHHFLCCRSHIRRTTAAVAIYYVPIKIHVDHIFNSMSLTKMISHVLLINGRLNRLFTAQHPSTIDYTGDFLRATIRFDVLAILCILMTCPSIKCKPAQRRRRRRRKKIKIKDEGESKRWSSLVLCVPFVSGVRNQVDNMYNVYIYFGYLSQDREIVCMPFIISHTRQPYVQMGTRISVIFILSMHSTNFEYKSIQNTSQQTCNDPRWWWNTVLFRSYGSPRILVIFFFFWKLKRLRHEIKTSQFK